MSRHKSRRLLLSLSIRRDHNSRSAPAVCRCRLFMPAKSYLPQLLLLLLRRVRLLLLEAGAARAVIHSWSRVEKASANKTKMMATSDYTLNEQAAFISLSLLLFFFSLSRSLSRSTFVSLSLFVSFSCILDAAAGGLAAAAACLHINRQRARKKT